MQEGGFFYQAFIYLSAAVIAVPLAKKMGLGSVLGYLLAGVAIGPFVLGLVGQEGQDVMHFAEFGVVMMLFLVGLELQPSLLWKLRAPILGLGGLQVVITTAVIMIIVLISTSLPWQTALALGLSLALSSTAIVLQTLNEKGLMKTEGGQNSFSVLLFQDIAVIPILAIFPLLSVAESSAAAGHESHTLIDGLPIIIQTLVVLGVVGFLILAGKYLISPIFRLIAQTRLRELFTAAALLLVIAIALLMTQVGLSPALGTFLAGVVLAQSEYRHELETDIEPFKGLLLGLFFIAVGASIDFELIGGSPGLIAMLVVSLIVIKLTILFIIGKFFKMSLDNNLLFAFGLAQGGEFAFVLFSFALQNGVITHTVSDPLIAAVAITMALTPLLMIVNEKVLQPRLGTKEQSKREPDEIDEENPVIIAGFGRFGSTIGRFLQANGVQSTYLDVDPNNVDLLRKMGLKVFYGDASRHDLLHAAGAESARLLIVAVDNTEKRVEIIETAQKHYPNLKIIARSTSWDDSYQLLDMNISNVYREFFDTSLRIGSDALAMLGQRRYQISRAVKKFRKHDENYVRELAELRHEKSDLISETGGNHTVRFDHGGESHEVTGEWVVDTSGRDRHLAGRMETKTKSEIRHSSAFFWTEGTVNIEKLTNATRDEYRKRPERAELGHLPFWLATNHFCGEGYWFWVIPLHSRTSFGLVFDNQLIDVKDVNTEEKLLQWLFEEYPLFEHELSLDKMIDFQVLHNYSHNCDRTISADKWAMSGFSGRFTDPLYSPGGDAIAIYNTLIVDAIKSETDEDLAKKINGYEAMMDTVYRSYVPSFHLSYNALGDQEAFSMKYVWELSIYFSFYVFPFINDLYTDRLFLVSYLRRFSQLGKISRSLLIMISDYYEWKKENVPKADRPRFFEFKDVETLQRAESTFYEVGLEAKEALQVLDEQLDHLRELARFYVAHISAVVAGDPELVHSRDHVEAIDLAEIRFDPDEIRSRWSTLPRSSENYPWTIDADVFGKKFHELVPV